MSGASSRRFACDRCQASKQRCLRREDRDAERCDRCTQANVQCITTRAAPTFQIFSYSGKKRARKRSRLDSPEAQRPVGSNPGFRRRDPSLDQDCLHPPVDDGADTSPANMLMDLFADTPPTTRKTSGMTTFSSPQDMPSDHWGEQHLSVPVVSDNLPGLSMAPLTLNTNCDFSWDVENIMLNDFVFPDMEERSTRPQDSNEGLQEIISPRATCFPSQISPPQPLPRSVSISETSAYILPSFPIAERSKETGRDDEFAGTPADAFGKQHHKAKGRGLITARETETHAQALTKLNLSLIEQLDHIKEGLPHVTFGTLTLPINETGTAVTPLGNILNDTKRFLNILTRMNESTRGSRTVASSHKASKHNVSAYETPETQNSSSTASSSSSAYSSTASSSPESVVSPVSPELIGINTGTEQRHDTTVLLLILTCYINVVRLYVVLFTQTLDFLEDVSASEDSAFGLLPGLCFGNFPIQSRSLQVAMLIQIVTNLLEKTESQLGLPSECRISSRERHKNCGLISDDDFSRMAKAMMKREEYGRPENGKGGIKALRRYIRKVKELSRENMTT
ncbi:hypothetical protein DL766_009226 [Monosporascus sp. MC13-8B]|uniref:Zn(2)-C6 fungal-type domain-containing protein n=1 Tax=Monosporascus cannonballus TaxID=155416 RepID=A0ABY0GZZ8_9PEZI|nr:hypothetical protein DL762_008664 [Monosporascus cannonballus]RYO81029.1 hypothetical protein DL763_008703 [Monosporascus cannonballus]RYP16089.1 hypothetical protein DL766_009226 [Monosporascus sp. MC13-8B]